MGVYVRFLLCGVDVYVVSILAIILLKKKSLLHYFKHFFNCVVCIFLKMQLVCLLSLIMAFSGHTHLLSLVYSMIMNLHAITRHFLET